MKAIDYRDMRPVDLKKGGKYSYLKLLLFWPAFGLVFFSLERFFTNRNYTVIHCRLDDLIPFSEWFLFAYLFWFVFMVGMLAYGVFYEPENYRKYMKFIMISFSITLVIYVVFPTEQNLRPQTFVRNDILTRFITDFYQFDTDTDVMPSLHVIGSMAVLFGAWNSRLFGKAKWKVVFTVITVLICLSTMFLKQHSVIDVATALVLSFAVYPIAFWDKKEKPLFAQVK